MRLDPTRVMIGFYFYPRGGSAHATKAIARELRRNGLDVCVVSGSRSDVGEQAKAESFFGPDGLRGLDFTPALESADPVHFRGGPGTAPIHASYEDRPGVEDPVFTMLDDDAFEAQVEAWTAEFRRAGAGESDVLYLNHLTPMNEAAAREAPEVPVIGHVHGTELLMLERIESGQPESWTYADAWRERLRRWAAGCERIVVNGAEGLERASRLLGVPRERFSFVPNGFGREFAPREVDRQAVWRRTLHSDPHGWRPGEPAGSVAYSELELEALRGSVLLAVGRFTEVKRLPLLIEAFASARRRFSSPAALVLVGGYPGEWEGEHPAETVERLGADGVFLAGWHAQEELPELMNAADALVHASVHEQFGQVLVEAMACGLPVIAVERGGPAAIVDDGETGWLVPPDDREALERAMAEAVDHPEERRIRGRRARGEVVGRYSWRQVGERIAELVSEVSPVGARRAR